METFGRYERAIITAILALAFVVAVRIHSSGSRFSAVVAGNYELYRLDRRTGEVWYVIHGKESLALPPWAKPAEK